MIRNEYLLLILALHSLDCQYLYYKEVGTLMSRVPTHTTIARVLICLW